MNQKTWAAVVVTFALSILTFGCQSGGIGDPCIPEDEYQLYFSGYSETEVNLESRSFQCETRAFRISIPVCMFWSETPSRRGFYVLR